jgi:hypothetical protein
MVNEERERETDRQSGSVLTNACEPKSAGLQKKTSEMNRESFLCVFLCMVHDVKTYHYSLCNKM